MTEAVAAYPPRMLAWRSAIIIFVLSAIATADRMSIAMLIGPIKREFGIGDFQASLLMGAAFTSFYVLFLIPIGWAADRWSRRWVLGICLFVWSLVTVACGWATGFAALFMLRMLVGAGEAGMAPSVHGILGDSFPKHALAKPMAMQGIGFQVGSAAGVAAAGAILAASAGGAFQSWPILGEMTHWRVAFVLIGLPGLAALLLIPLLHDPREVNRTAGMQHPVQPLLPFVRANPGLVMMALLSSGFSAMALGCVTGWVPEYLQRSLGVSPMGTGATLGTLMLVAAFVGQGSYAVIVDWLAARGVKDAAIKVGLVPYALALPACLIAFRAQDFASFTAWLTVLLLCIAPSNAMSNTIVQLISPPGLRSRMSALAILSVSILGFTLGPALVGWLSQYVFGEAQLGLALQLTLAVAVSGTTLLFLLMRPRLVAHLSQ